MVQAYVLIDCEVDSVLSVVDQVSAIEDVVDVDPVTGKHDVIAKMEVDEVGKLRDLVANQIHASEGVNSTQTCIST